MVKHPKKRRFRRYIKGKVHYDLSLTTLAAETAVSEVVADALSEPAYLSSVKASWAMADFTPAAGDGPIEVGVAHSDYTTAEIEEWIENTNSWEEADMIGQEVAKRKIRSVGIFPTPDELATQAVVLANGRLITTKCGWMLMGSQTLRIWAFNHGNSALATTVPIVTIAGHCNLWPR